MLAGGLWYKIGWLLLLVTVIAMCFVLGKDIDTVASWGMVICFLQIIPLVGSICSSGTSIKEAFRQKRKSPIISWGEVFYTSPLSLSKSGLIWKEPGRPQNLKKDIFEKVGKQERGMSPCFPSGQLFEVHGSKFKPHPVGNWNQTTVVCITHGVLFFRIRKNPFNGFFAFGVKVLVFRGVSGVIGQHLVVLPDMALNSLHAVFRAGA